MLRIQALISNLEKQYIRIDIFIQCLTWFLVLLIVGFICAELFKHHLCAYHSSLCVYVKFISEAIEITKTIIPLLAALLATLVANRHISHSKINLEHEKLFEVVQITHRYIAIANDLESKVSYLNQMFKSGEHATTEFAVITDSIEKRYESLFEKEAYKYLSGETINTINAMSPSIYGIMSAVFFMKEKHKSDPTKLVPPVVEPPIDNLLEQIRKFRNDLMVLRKSTESN